MSVTDGGGREPEGVLDRLAAIQHTAGSAGDIFEPGYLRTLREDWSGRGTPALTPSAADDADDSS